ncbi:MAG: hypothetical protein KGL39_49750 [Patescibacteria group bacterium]|nr:hypothetical protein [Patescibacteria group bacterium]
MTRDQAIKLAGDVLKPASPEMEEIVRRFVEALAALGVLKLEDDKACPVCLETGGRHKEGCDGLSAVFPRTATSDDLDKWADSVDATGAPRDSGGAYIGGKWVEDAAKPARDEPPPNTMRVDMTVVEDDRVRRSPFDRPVPAPPPEPPPEHRAKGWHWLLRNGLHDDLVPHRWTEWGWAVCFSITLPSITARASTSATA